MEPIKHHNDDLVVYDPATTIGSCLALGFCVVGVLYLAPSGFRSWVLGALAAGVVISAARINLLTTRRRLIKTQRELLNVACSVPGRVLLQAIMANGLSRECRLSDLENVRFRDFIGKNPTRLCREIRGQLAGKELVFLPMSMSGGLLRRDEMSLTGEGYRNPVDDVSPFTLEGEDSAGNEFR